LVITLVVDIYADFASFFEKMTETMNDLVVLRTVARIYDKNTLARILVQIEKTCTQASCIFMAESNVI
jgi:hypothetical protein